MHWWQNWGHALAHPADNVVAATIVLIGVVVTGLVTIGVTATGRRFDRRREALARIFQTRSETYLEARKFITRAPVQSDKEREKSGEKMSVIAAKLDIYCSLEATELFVKAVSSMSRALDLDSKTSSDNYYSALDDASHYRDLFSELARRDIQGIGMKATWMRPAGPIKRRIRRLRRRCYNFWAAKSKKRVQKRNQRSIESMMKSKT